MPDIDRQKWCRAREWTKVEWEFHIYNNRGCHRTHIENHGQGSYCTWFCWRSNVSSIKFSIYKLKNFIKRWKVLLGFGFCNTCRVPLKPLFLGGNIPPTAYRVVKEENYKGEIKVALTFTPAQVIRDKSLFFFWVFRIINDNVILITEGRVCYCSL